MSVRTGALIVGILEIVFGVLGIGASIDMLVIRHTHDKLCNITVEHFAKLTNGTQTLDINCSDSGLESVPRVAIDIAIILISLVFSVLLIKGIQKNNVKMIKAWLIFSVVYLALSILYTLVEFFLGVHWLDLITIVPEALLGVYFIAIVYAFYKELERGGDGAMYYRFGRSAE